MKSLADPNDRLSQLITFFASYLKDMIEAISSVKALSYQLINTSHPKSTKISITSDVPSIMAACKRAYDDIKRAQSILKGHVRGKNSRGNESRSQTGSSLNLGIARAQFTSKLSKGYLGSRAELQKEFDSNGLENGRQSEPRSFEKSRIREEETKSTRLSNHPLVQTISQKTIEEKEDSFGDARRNQHKSPKLCEKNMQIPLKRRSQKDDSVRSHECLAIIHKIREQLQVSKP